jgi:ATP-binding cassette subfamily F protein 3
MFHGDDVTKKVKSFQEREKTRLAMINYIGTVNLLILDEPSNHLDMKTKDIIKDALRSLWDFDLGFSRQGFPDGLATKVNLEIKE